MNRALALVTVALGFLPGVANAAQPPGLMVEAWVRGPRNAENGESAHLRSRRFDLDKLALTIAERHDAQYGRVAEYRGIPLQWLLDRVAPEPSVDLAILHFANGMAVPILFRDVAVMKRLHPFVARAMRTPRAGWLAPGQFPAIAKPGAAADGHPISFSGNKIVVADRWHPDVASGRAPAFSPWAHCDTLVGIELVAARPYYGQFDAGEDAAVHRGLALFRQSCQFCHGVRHVGATFGWDLVESAPMYRTQDSAANLYHHIANKPTNAADLGLMMPAINFMTEADAADVRQWLQALASLPIPAYAPTHSGE